MRRSPAAAKALSECFNKCAYCLEDMQLEYGKPNSVTFDHVIAKSKGGKSKIPVCFTCNAEKGAKSIFNFLMEKHKNDPEIIKEIFYDVTSRISPDERLRLERERKGVYLRMQLGPANNFEPRGGTPTVGKHKKAASRPRLSVQEKLFGDDY